MYILMSADLCRYAMALRPIASEAYEDSSHRIQLPGELDPQRLGLLMSHNKSSHNCNTEDQCNLIVKLFRSRFVMETNFKYEEFLAKAIKAMELRELMDRERGVTSFRVCHPKPDSVEPVVEVMNFLTEKGNFTGTGYQFY